MAGAVEPDGWMRFPQYLRAIVSSEFFLGKHKALPDLKHCILSAAVDFAMGFEKEHYSISIRYVSDKGKGCYG